MKQRRFSALVLASLVVLSVSLAGCAGGGSLVPNANTTPQQALINNQNLYSNVLVPMYDGAVTAANALWSAGKISAKDWTTKVSPSLHAASDALTAYRNAYTAGLNPAPGTSGSSQAAQAAIQGIFTAIAEFTATSSSHGPPPTTLPAAPSSRLVPDPFDVRPAVAVVSAGSR